MLEYTAELDGTDARRKVYSIEFVVVKGKRSGARPHRARLRGR